jgi:hypothetical protein
MHTQQTDIDRAFAEIVNHLTKPQPTDTPTAQPIAPAKTAEPNWLDKVNQTINTHPYLMGERGIWYGFHTAGAGERTARHLDHATTLIKRDGWTQGIYGNPDAGYCIKGALSTAIRSGTGASQDTYSAGLGCIELVLRAMAGSCQEAAGWNDAPGRTADEVVTVLRQAAEVARRFGP